MDYGMRLTRHVLQQVFGNLRQAAQLTLVPSVAVAVLAIWTFSRVPEELFLGVEPTPEMVAAIPWGLILLTLVAGAVMFAWIAVGWHRYVLLEEYGTGLTPRWLPGHVGAYLLRSILIFAILAAIAFVVMLVLGILIAGLGAASGAIVFMLTLNLLLGWLFVRMGLILPAGSVGRALRIGESWQATGPVSGEILVPIIAFAVLFGVIPQALGLMLFGGGLPAVVALPLTWLQMLVNLALLTTLYGNRIEGRALN